MIIKKLSEKPNSIPKLAQWFQNQWGYLYPNRTVHCVEKNLQTHLAGHPVPTTFLACIDNQLIGTAALVHDDMEIRPQYSPWLASVYVDQPFRKQGIGGVLIERVCEHAKQSNIETIYLFTPDQEAWYKKSGWYSIEAINYHQANVVVMKKDLK